MTFESVMGPYICSLAVVRGLHRGHHLIVREGPTKDYVVRATLTEGSRVYICDGFREWYGIVFSTPQTPCGDQQLRGLNNRAASRCRSGWVRREWLDILTG